jgi:hypothetical protein
MATRPNPAHLLSLLADALNACERAGMKPKLRHGGVVETKGGFVIRAEVGWVPRTLAYTEFIPAAEGDDGDD